MLSRAEFEALFDTFTESAWRLEIQPAYDEPEEREPLRRWLAGEPGDLEWIADWWAWISDITRAGKRFGRVRVVYDPPSDYQRYELGVLTPPAVEAGEDIRILPAARARELDLPTRDFWLFDDARVAVLHFGSDGVTGAELIEDAAAVRQFQQARDRAWDASVAYREWAHVNTERSPLGGISIQRAPAVRYFQASGAVSAATRFTPLRDPTAQRSSRSAPGWGRIQLAGLRGCPSPPSQEAFADIVGVHCTYTSGLKRGEWNITLRVLERIAERIEVFGTAAGGRLAVTR